MHKICILSPDSSKVALNPTHGSSILADLIIQDCKVKNVKVWYFWSPLIKTNLKGASQNFSNLANDSHRVNFGWQ